MKNLIIKDPEKLIEYRKVAYLFGLDFDDAVNLLMQGEHSLVRKKYDEKFVEFIVSSIDFIIIHLYEIDAADPKHFSYVAEDPPGRSKKSIIDRIRSECRDYYDVTKSRAGYLYLTPWDYCELIPHLNDGFYYDKGTPFFMKTKIRVLTTLQRTEMDLE